MNILDQINEFNFIRNVVHGDIITEEGIKTIGIHKNKAIITGKLFKTGKILFIFSKTSKYYPELNDIVIGRIFSVQPTHYKVNITHDDLRLPLYTGILDQLSFENATKRNKPELEIGDLVLCKITDMKKNDMQIDELLLSCNQPGLGQIQNVFRMERWKVVLLHFLNIKKEICKNFTTTKKFKIALSMNGYVCIDSEEFLEIKEAILKIIK